MISSVSLVERTSPIRVIGPSVCGDKSWSIDPMTG